MQKLFFGKIHTIFLFFCLWFSFNSNAQFNLNKANRAFENFEYSKAIPLYEKVLKRHKDTTILANLGLAYRLTENYLKAEQIYAELVTYPDISPKHYFHYGEALKNNGKYKEAKEQFLIYQKMVPMDDRGKLLTEVCEKIIARSDSLIRVMVVNVASVNTKYSEFSPFPYKDGLMITSDRKKNFIDLDTYEWTARPFLSIYYYPNIDPEDVTPAKPFILNNPINDDFHNGPAVFYNDTTLFFTRVSQRKSKRREKEITHRAKIFYCTYHLDIKKKNVNTIIYPFQYNSDDYSVGHPCFTPDGNLLFFSSDMPGGYGGKDIYVCMKQDSGWSEPKNLGTIVNTYADELFPFAKNERTVYFSSNGHPGHGGMDIFSATKSGNNWSIVNNIKSPINSPTDDFGIYFTGNNTGYFSSNRNGGKGFDDLYFFDIIQRVISGRLFCPVDSTPLINRLIILLDEKGNVVDSTYTNEEGGFAFTNLKSDVVYSTKMEENDLGIAGFIENTFNEKPRTILVYITDKQKNIIDSLHLQSREFFSFWRLKAESYDVAISNLVDIGLKSQDLIGFEGKIQIRRNNMIVPGASVRLILDGANEDIHQMITANDDGSFSFDSLSNYQSYMITLDGEDVDSLSNDQYIVSGKIHYTGDTNKIVSNARFYFSGKYNKRLIAVYTDKGGYFKFDFMAGDFYSLAPLFAENPDAFFIEPDHDPVYNLSVEKTAQVDSSYVDFYGSIYYDNDTTKPVVNVGVLLKNETEDVVKKTSTDSSGSFRFDYIKNDQAYSVGMAEDDPKFNPNLTYLILGNIDYHGKKIPAERFQFFLGGRYDKNLFTMVTDENGRFRLSYLPSQYYSMSKINEDDINMIIDNAGYSVTILFDYESSTVGKQYHGSLKSISDMLFEDASLIAVISGHSDSKGPDKYNMLLSKQRATSVADYLVAKGIKRKRLTINAYGETQLVAPDNNADGSDNAEARAKNRRAEIKVIQKPKSNTK